MSIFPFEVKRSPLLTDVTRGYPRLHPDVRAMLQWVCDFARTHAAAPPVVTCFGRTRDDQEEIYLPAFLQELEHDGITSDKINLEAARERARRKFSWHCVPVNEDRSLGYSRAFDLRYWVWSPQFRKALIEAARAKWPTAELLDHAVPGGSRHLHLGLPAPAGKPADWL